MRHNGLLFVFYMLLSLAGTQTVQGQNKELDKLVQAVASLRQPDAARQKAVYQTVAQALEKDKEWTPMDEIVADVRLNECRPTDKNMGWFRLNTILNTIMQKRNGLSTSRGDFLNGEDPNFNYSLIEKSVKAGKSVSYTMKGRQGSQEFVVMPFDVNGTGSLNVDIYRQTKGKWTKMACEKQVRNGNIYLTIKEKVTSDTQLKLQIDNKGTTGMALVIINHNTRK